MLMFSHVYAAYNTDGLVGYWKFDESSTGTAADASGHNNHGTHVTGGSFGIATDVPTTSFTNPRSLSFDDDYVSIADSTSLDVTNITIAFWVKPSGNLQTSGAAFVCKGNGAGGEVWCIDISGNNFRFFFWKGGVAYASQSTSAIGTDWKHVAATYDGTNAIVYINGVAEDTEAHGIGNLDTNSHALTIGARQSGSADYDLLFDGHIDDVRIYSRALSSTEIGQLASGDHTTATWDGSSTSDFETAANWDINAVPDPYTHLLFPETYPAAELSAAVSGASLTIEANGLTGASLDLHGFDFEFVDSGTLKGGGTLRLLGSETLPGIANISTTSTGTVLYYGTGSYSGLTAGDTYYRLNLNDGLVGYWDFDASEGGYVRDVSGYDADGVRGGTPNDPTFVSTPAPTAFFNRYALEFDGNDKVDLNHPFPFRASQYAGTAAVWVKTDNPSSDQIIFWTEENRDRGLIIDGGNSAFAGMYYDANVSHMRVASGGTVTTAWHHVAYTWDLTKGTVRLFVDGKAVASSVGSASTTNSNDNRSGIGEYVGAGDFVSGYNNFDGLLDDFRIYDRVLQDQEISALASGNAPATASGTFTLDAALTVNDNLTLPAGLLDVSSSNYQVTVGGSWQNFGGQFNARSGIVRLDSSTSDEDIFSGGQAFTNLSITGAGSWNIRDVLDADGYISLTGGNVDATTNNYNVHAYDFDQSSDNFIPRSGMLVLNGSSDVSSTITSTLNELQIEDPTEDGLLAYWKFDECQTDTTEDVSGNSQTGTIYGPAVWTGSGLPSPIDFDNHCALSFDGSDNQFVESANNSTLTGNATFSIALWFYVPTGANTDGSYGRFIDWGTASNGQSAQISVYSSTINQLFVGHWGTGQASTTTFSNDAWHHVVWVREGGSNNGHQGNTLYLDGVEIPLDINVSTAKTINVTADKYDIGGRGSGNLSVECMLDDVRVYDRVLTPIEIRRLASGQYANGAVSTATVTLGGNLDLDTMTILSGKLAASSRTIDVSGDWNNYAGSGAFTKGTSTVDLDGASTQNVRGSTDFYDFEISTNSAQTVAFGSGTTQYISHALTLAGAASNLLTLNPLTTAIEWFLDVAEGATQSVSYVLPSYSNASPGETITATSSTDGGNNTNWNFSTGTSGGSGGWRSNRQALERAQNGYSDAIAPALTAVGIANETVAAVTNFIGGILHPSQRNQEQDIAEFSRRVQQVTAALTERFQQGIYEYRIAMQKSAETLKTSAPNLDDATRRLQRAERNVADNSLTKLTASAIGEKRGLLVAMVKSEEVVYVDVPVDSWFTPFVSAVIDEDIATGYEDAKGKPTGEFGVQNPVTYAEILKMALKTSDTDIVISAPPRNSSAVGTWASSYVSYAESKAISVITPDRNVHAPATRGEMVQIILEVMGLPIAKQASHFTDVPETHPYAHAIATAAFYGIITGDTDTEGNLLNTFRPDAIINRAEVVKIIALLNALHNK
ncbi:S-layer homology domain-containing protein [Candidatus Peribacteria bacterium]|nr:S-layer homology domain-containing protein [Candidatus Peribacteria bacterium]